MDKYQGCNKVEAVVTQPKTAVNVKKRGVKKFLIKLGISAVAIGFILLVRFVPALSAVRDALRSVFCYDFFGRTEFGGTPLISGLGLWG